MLQVYVGPEAPTRIEQEGGTGLHDGHIQNEARHRIRADTEVRTGVVFDGGSVPRDYIPGAVLSLRGY